MMNARKQGFQRIKVDGKVHDLNEILPTLDKNKKHDIEIIVDRVVITEDLGNRLADSVETALKLSEGLLHVEIVSLPEGTKSAHKTGDVLVFSEKFSCPVSGFTISEIEPRLFSFNSPFGACKHCDGLGTELYFSEDLVVEDENLSLRNGAIVVWQGVQERFYQQVLQAMALHYDFSLDTPFKQLSNEVKKIIFYGTNGEEVEIKIEDGLKAIKVKKTFEKKIFRKRKRVDA
jgi:excinuclease ABC subunit A